MIPTYKPDPVIQAYLDEPRYTREQWASISKLPIVAKHVDPDRLVNHRNALHLRELIEDMRDAAWEDQQRIASEQNGMSNRDARMDRGRTSALYMALGHLRAEYWLALWGDVLAERQPEPKRELPDNVIEFPVTRLRASSRLTLVCTDEVK